MKRELQELRREFNEYRAHDAERQDRRNNLLLSLNNKVAVLIVLAGVFLLLIILTAYWPVFNLVNVIK